MNRTLYALLVGINEYPNPRHRLNGCVNDVTRMVEYLHARFDESSGFQLAPPRVLLNKEATREQVIQAFREQLGPAKEGDVALFYYSGHGSQERAPKEFWRLEPDKLDETLVCYDSRSDMPGCYDLADKELAYLIEEVAKNGPHVVVILDSCHSGSGTRDLREQATAVRRVETDLRERPLDSFIMKVEDANRLAVQPGERAESGWSAAGRHILFAACRDDEEAVEYHAVGPDGKVEPRGTFSYFLGEALRTITGPITYRELFASTSALVRTKVRGQSPQLETVNPVDLDGLLFDGAIRPAQPFYTLAYLDDRWQINAGAVHGLPPVDPEEPTLLDVFPFHAPQDDLRTAAKALTRVAVTGVEPTNSEVQVGDDAKLDPSQPYKAVIAALPLPRIGVVFEPFDSEGARLAREALATAHERTRPSLYIREAGLGAPDRFRLLAKDGGYVITSPENDRPLVARIEGLNPSTARLAIERLEHIARWTLTSELTNSATTVQPRDIDLVLIKEDGTELRGPEIRLEYQLKDGRWEPAKFKIKLVNRTNRDGAQGRTLYCGLLDLAETYAINAGLHEAGCIRLGPGDEAWAAQGRLLAASLPDKLWQQGIVEFKDILKLIVSTSDFDVNLMTQGALEMPTRKAMTRGLPPRRGSLNRLMNRMQTRNLEVVREGEDLDDWWTTQLTFTTVRPLESTPVPNAPGRSVSLAGGVRLLDHPTLKANARLNPASVTSRDLGNLALPHLLRDDSTVSLPFTLTATRGRDAGLSTLELTGVEGETYKTVTPEQPLRLVVPNPLGDGEFVLAVGYDGEFFLPLGRAKPSSGGTTELVLERLPEPTSEGKKSLSGSIKIFFQKIFGPWVGRPSEYPILAAADVGDDGEVVYAKDRSTIRDCVGKAQNILLYVHGIIGDTREMASSALRGGFAGLYDLILTFDYENLNTPITENARLLREQLVDVGLGPGPVQKLDVAAHSMGGLVSRWFIEREGGDRIVRRLVMLGTPNGGSPWPGVVDWATIALGLGLNGLTGTPWPARVLSGLAATLGDPRVALKEMMPGSETLGELSRNPASGIPYTMLAGDTSIVRSESEPVGSEAVTRLIGRLFGGNPLYAFADPFFRDQVNDIAVAVASMTQVPPAILESMKVVPTSCDHLTYFRSDAGLKALSAALGG
jgi:pimeloyl-ACP methyl ester carboxylesterase